ncbi:unnamed protein product, partial [Heterosigma akashiwo]
MRAESIVYMFLYLVVLIAPPAYGFSTMQDQSARLNRVRKCLAGKVGMYSWSSSADYLNRLSPNPPQQQSAAPASTLPAKPLIIDVPSVSHKRSALFDSEGEKPHRERITKKRPAFFGRLAKFFTMMILFFNLETVTNICSN